MWITSMGNHGAAGGISERRCSSCSSFICVMVVLKSRVLKLHYLYYWRHDSLQHHKHAAPSSAHLIMKYQYMLITLNMLIYFKHYKINSHIFNLILDLAWLKLMKLNLEQQYILSALHSQYHVCWCPGDFRSQGISRNGIDSQSQNIRRVNTY